MTKIDILIQGYAKKIDNGWIASSTVSLIKDSDKNIIVDPGCNREKLLNELKKRNLKTSDIDYVFLTHLHIDHSLLAGIFENAKVLDSYQIYLKDKQIEHNQKIPGTSIEIMKTPGHTDDHSSLIVKTQQGIYVVAGDVFWWTDDEKQDILINKIDQAYEFKHNDLVKSRKKILDIADFIVPGHGKVFKIKR